MSLPTLIALRGDIAEKENYLYLTNKKQIIMPPYKAKTNAFNLIYLLTNVICVTILYLLGNLDKYIKIFDIVVTILPGVILLILCIIWAANSSKGKFVKVIAGFLLGLASSLIIYYKYLEEILKWINEKTEQVTGWVYIIIIFSSLMHSLLTYNQSKHLR
jgi:hypothetical protein